MAGVCMGGMHGRGHAWPGVCVARGVCGRGCMHDMHALPGRYHGYGIPSMSGRYASYWNALLFQKMNLTSGKSCSKILKSHINQKEFPGASD